MLLSALPVDWRKPQSPPVHFFAKSVGILLHWLADKSIAPARLNIRVDLPPNVFIEYQKTFVTRV